jgi:hypothetical protein
MTTQHLGYQVTIETNKNGKRIECKVISNPVETSYHDIDEMAETDEEALEMFCEWLDEQEEARKKHREVFEKMNQE